MSAGSGVELIAVREAHRFDEARLERYLSAHLDGFEPPLRVRQFEGGQSNPTFLIEAGGDAFVLRKKPPGQLLPSAHAVDREYRVMTGLRETAVPVPRTIHLCEDADVIGTPFVLMQNVPGRVLRDPLLPGLARAERRALYGHFIEVLAALHGVDPAAVGLATFGRPGNYYARQIARWSSQYQVSKTDDIPAMDDLMLWLLENVPAGDETAIVHGDYRIENTIIHPSEPRIVAVLDWELSTLGHPLADVAFCCMGYHGSLGTVESLAGNSFEATGIPSEAEFLELYCRHAGRDAIEDWRFYIVFALFRIAAIGQGVYKRGLDGIAASARATSFGDACRIRAERA